jgi:hypothetical protein
MLRDEQDWKNDIQKKVVQKSTLPSPFFHRLPARYQWRENHFAQDGTSSYTSQMWSVRLVIDGEPRLMMSSVIDTLN